MENILKTIEIPHYIALNLIKADGKFESTELKRERLFK